MKRKYIPESEDTTNKMPPQKKRKIEEEITNMNTVKATKTWTKEIFKIQNNRIKGDSLEEKAAQILKAQNMITIMTKAHLLEENEEKIKLRKIIGDGGVDLFGEIVIHNQTLQWIAQCKMTKRLENSVVNEMKGLLSSRPNTIGFIIYGGKKGNTEIMTETANSDIFVCHIEELHTLRSQIENKHLKKGIKTTAVTRIHMDEIEDAEFDNLGRITKARKIKNVNIQSWGTTIYQNEDILFK
jgi:hypothetical protein